MQEKLKQNEGETVKITVLITVDSEHAHANNVWECVPIWNGTVMA
jgi:hypothetical protein